MSDFDKRDESGNRQIIPSWDGAPAGWQRYQEQVRLWRMGENLDVKYSVAARLVARLSGAARRACINMTEESLMPQRGRDAVEAVDDIEEGEWHSCCEQSAEDSGGCAEMVFHCRGSLCETACCPRS